MNNIKRTTRIATLCLAAPFCLPSIASAAEGEGWDWMVAPYGWAAGVSTDLSTDVPPSSSSSDSDFDDIVDKIDGAFQIHAEGQGDDFGVFADFTFLGLADENNHPRFRTASDLDTRLFEIAAVWSPGEERFNGVEVFAGLRYIDVDLTAELEPLNPAFPTVRVDGGESFSDFMLGARYTWALSERWGLTLRGDGSFGETEGTWNASGVLQYRMKRGAWLVGYRYLDAEFETGNTSTGIVMSGPMFGYGFKF